MTTAPYEHRATSRSLARPDSSGIRIGSGVRIPPAEPVHMVRLAIDDGLLPAPAGRAECAEGPREIAETDGLGPARCWLLFPDSRGFCSAGRDAIGCALLAGHMRRLLAESWPG